MSHLDGVPIPSTLLAIVMSLTWFYAIGSGVSLRTKLILTAIFLALYFTLASFEAWISDLEWVVRDGVS